MQKKTSKKHAPQQKKTEPFFAMKKHFFTFTVVDENMNLWDVSKTNGKLPSCITPYLQNLETCLLGLAFGPSIWTRKVRCVDR